MNRTLLLLTAASTLALAQSPSGGWRRVGEAPPPGPQQHAEQQPIGPAADPEPVDRSDAYGQPVGPQQPVDQGRPELHRRLDPQDRPDPQGRPEAPPPMQHQNDRPPSARQSYGPPPEVTLRPGTFVTVRINQMLSSDHNQPGDTFVGSLAQPLVVDGIVVANRNQMIYGRVAEAQRAHSDRPSRLGLELTSLTLADGSQVPIRSQLAARQGGRTPTDVQVGTVATTTIAGAAIGGIAGYGTGAAAGAGIGAIAGIAGVMLTRNRPTVIYPESALTFAILSPLTISTAAAPQAFRFVAPEDYPQGSVHAGLQPRPQGMPAYPVYGPYPYPYPYYAPYPYYGGVSVYVGPRWGYGYYGHRRYGRW